MNSEQREELLHKLIDQARNQELPYEKRPKKSINWTDYDVAQCNEIVDALDLIRDLVDTADSRIQAHTTPEKPGPGRPPTDAANIAKALLLQSFLGISNRVAEGFVRMLGPKLGIDENFSYKTIERGYDREAVNAILDEVMRISNAPIEGLEKTFSIDGSGTPTRMKQNYAHDRERQNKERKKEGKDAPSNDDAFPKGHHDYVYEVSTVGVEYKLIASYENTTDHSRGEMSFFKRAAMETKALHPATKMLCADGAFANRPVCEILNELGITPRTMPKRNATLKRKGVFAWTQMLMALLRDPQGWLRQYYLREASETVNSMLKRRNPWPLRKRLDDRKLTEDLLRAVNHNVRRLCYLYYLVDLQVLAKLKALAM
jgi:transposase